MKAIFQGEFHTSESDKESLLTHLDEDVDALFVEQREDTLNPDNWNVGYLSFIIGTCIYYWFQALLDSGPRITDEADMPVFDDIDTPLPELYARFPSIWTVPTGVFSGSVFLYGVFISEITIPFIAVPPAITTIYTVVMKPVFVIGAPVLFSGLLIYFEERRMGSRDEDMAVSITEAVEERGFHTVVVLCGDMHLDRLPGLLEKKGWDVEVHASNHSKASKLWRSEA